MGDTKLMDIFTFRDAYLGRLLADSDDDTPLAQAWLTAAAAAQKVYMLPESYAAMAYARSGGTVVAVEPAPERPPWAQTSPMVSALPSLPFVRARLSAPDVSQVMSVLWPDWEQVLTVGTAPEDEVSAALGVDDRLVYSSLGMAPLRYCFILGNEVIVSTLPSPLNIPRAATTGHYAAASTALLAAQIAVRTQKLRIELEKCGIPLLPIPVSSILLVGGVGVLFSPLVWRGQTVPAHDETLSLFVPPPTRPWPGSNLSADMRPDPAAPAPASACPALARAATAWSTGAITTFDYLCAVNAAAGRCPASVFHHPIFPWCMEAGAGGRVVAGVPSGRRAEEVQGAAALEATYKMSGYHIAEYSCDLSLLMLAYRVCPPHVIFRYVRPNFVPAMAPQSLAALIAFSPNEAPIDVFAPTGALAGISPQPLGSVAAFLSAHLAALNSPAVAAAVPHWIDRTFGYLVAASPEAVAARCVPRSATLAPAALVADEPWPVFRLPHPPRLPAPAPTEDMSGYLWTVHSATTRRAYREQAASRASEAAGAVRSAATATATATEWAQVLAPRPGPAPTGDLSCLTHAAVMPPAWAGEGAADLVPAHPAAAPATAALAEVRATSERFARQAYSRRQAGFPTGLSTMASAASAVADGGAGRAEGISALTTAATKCRATDVIRTLCYVPISDAATAPAHVGCLHAVAAAAGVARASAPLSAPISTLCAALPALPEDTRLAAATALAAGAQYYAPALVTTVLAPALARAATDAHVASLLTPLLARQPAPAALAALPALFAAAVAAPAPAVTPICAAIAVSMLAAGEATAASTACGVAGLALARVAPLLLDGSQCEGVVAAARALAVVDSMVLAAPATAPTITARLFSAKTAPLMLVVELYVRGMPPGTEVLAEAGLRLVTSLAKLGRLTPELLEPLRIVCTRIAILDESVKRRLLPLTCDLLNICG